MSERDATGSPSRWWRNREERLRVLGYQDSHGKHFPNRPFSRGVSEQERMDVIGQRAQLQAAKMRSDEERRLQEERNAANYGSSIKPTGEGGMYQIVNGKLVVDQRFVNGNRRKSEDLRAIPIQIPVLVSAN